MSNTYLIVGLGNIGQEYIDTRHNIGFSVLDALVKGQKASFENAHLASLSNIKIKGRKLLLIKPSTYMNLSGKAVDYWLNKEHICQERLLVITDDIHLPFGRFRLKKSGSDGGHNGLKDIQQKLNTTTYNRFRFGVGGAFQKGKQVDHVLGKWSPLEAKELEESLLNRSTEAILTFVLDGIDKAMTIYNSKTLD